MKAFDEYMDDIVDGLISFDKSYQKFMEGVIHTTMSLIIIGWFVWALAGLIGFISRVLS